MWSKRDRGLSTRIEFKEMDDDGSLALPQFPAAPVQPVHPGSAQAQGHRDAATRSGLAQLVAVDTDKLEAYRKVCGFEESSLLPPTYPHVLAFPLQMQLMTSEEFPFPLLGLIHLANRTRTHRPLGGVSQLYISVQATDLRPHAKGATFTLVTQAEDGMGLLWEEESTLLCTAVHLEDSPVSYPEAAPLPLSELQGWRATAQIGREYAKVSGDYNPIHLSAPSARLFGFPRAIAHGMWLKARTLAALGEHLPASNVEISVQFRSLYACLQT